jgi:hypothetical protein
MTRPELVFLHIPKTAGTSQLNAFSQNYGAGNVFWIGKDCAPDIWRYPRAQVGQRFVVGGHKRLSFYPRRLDPLYCALLRDPIERAISLFVYHTRPDLAVIEPWSDGQARSQLLEKLLARGIDPDSMLNSIRDCRPFRQQISNYQCRYLSRGRATFAAVRRSLEGRDVAIGTVASYDRFQRELWDLLDWTQEAPARVNRSQDNYAAPYLQDEELVARIGALNSEDRALLQWVETQHAGLWLQLADRRGRLRRLRNLPLKPGRRKVRQWQWQDAADLWLPRGPGQLPWPLDRMLLAEPCRLLYMPTPGALDAGIQRLMLGLSGLPHRDALRALGIERVTAQFATGLRLDDRSEDQIAAIAAARDWFRFAIVYEPIIRLVQIYRQYFVEQREQLALRPLMYQLLADAQGREAPDCRLGISFRQFAEGVCSGRYDDPLWLPQYRYLAWANTYNRLYRPDEMAALEADLGAISGRPIRIEPAAAAIPAWAGAAPPQRARHADTLPGDLPGDPALWCAQLVDAALLEVIKACYAWDLRLYYNRAADKDNEPEVAGV